MRAHGLTDRYGTQMLDLAPGAHARLLRREFGGHCIAARAFCEREQRGRSEDLDVARADARCGVCGLDRERAVVLEAGVAASRGSFGHGERVLTEGRSVSAEGRDRSMRAGGLE